MNRMRYEPNPLAYSPSTAYRQDRPHNERCTVRLRGIEGVFAFTMYGRSSLGSDDIAQSPSLRGTLEFVKFLRDGD